MKKLIGFLAWMSATTAFAPTASAVPITYTFTATLGGTLGGVAFDGSVVFTGIGDTTDAIFRSPGAVEVPLSSVTIAVPTLGVVTPDFPPGLPVNFFEGSNSVAFGTVLPFVIISGGGVPLAGWDGLSDFGPASIADLGSDAFPTSGGTFDATQFDANGGFISFTASVDVPEPTAFELVAFGLFGLGIVRVSSRHNP
jgi:hypothetical protein